MCVCVECLNRYSWFWHINPMVISSPVLLLIISSLVLNRWAGSEPSRLVAKLKRELSPAVRVEGVGGFFRI